MRTSMTAARATAGASVAAHGRYHTAGTGTVFAVAPQGKKKSYGNQRQNDHICKIHI